MSDHTKLLMACMLHNAIVVICFTVLAVLFNHWWIVFFSWLLSDNIEYKKM